MKKHLALLFGLFLLATACMKKPESKPNYGLETTPDAINQAFAELTSDPSLINKGEFVYAETTIQIATLPPKLSMQLGETVTNKTASPSGWTLTIVQEQVLQDGDIPVTSKTERRACVPKDKTGECIVTYNQKTINPLSKKPALKVKDFLSAMASQKPAQSQKQRVTYHNLIKESVQFPLPNLVRLRSNCGGLAKCQNLRATSVSVDKVIWENETSGTKTTYRFIWSPDAPFFASQLLGCAQTWMDLQGQTAPVTQCEEVKDFTFGTP
jgi:hypothetical protein